MVFIVVVVGIIEIKEAERKRASRFAKNAKIMILAAKIELRGRNRKQQLRFCLPLAWDVFWWRYPKEVEPVNAVSLADLGGLLSAWNLEGFINPYEDLLFLI